MYLSRTRGILIVALLTAAGTVALAQQTTSSTPTTDGSGAQPPASFDQVQEDWVLVVATPDTEAVGPQITTCMLPTGTKDDPFVAFDMNYHEFPDFSPGGMQIQIWSDGDVTATSAQGKNLLSTRGEVVTWTQQLLLSNGRIYYDISNGQSQTWGSFGQGSNLSVSFSSPASSLAGYDPDISAARSGVSWESNRVQSLTLVRVRYYANGQLLYTDNFPRVVYTDNDDNPWDDDDDDD